ncbi:MAG: hypothetical protein ACREBH_02400 [Candidatus Micrarchaeaceae archaeon]
MIYYARMNRRLRNIRVYVTVKHIGKQEGFMTKLFIRLFNQQRGGGTEQSAIEKLK